MINPLKKYIKKNNLTQEQFARNLNCSLSMVAKLLAETNKDIRASMIYKIHKRTKIDYKTLIEWSVK